MNLYTSILSLVSIISKDHLSSTLLELLKRFPELQTSTPTYDADPIEPHRDWLWFVSFLATLSQLCYLPATQSHVEVFLEEHMQLSHIYRSALNQMYRPAFFLGYQSRLNIIVLCIRGTQSPQDWCTNLDCVGPRYHRGHWKASEYVLSNVLERLKLFREIFPKTQIVVTGHSLGGAIAAMLVHRLKFEYNFRDVFGVGFGPSPCINASMSRKLQPYFSTIVHGTDMICRLSRRNLELTIKNKSREPRLVLPGRIVYVWKTDSQPRISFQTTYRHYDRLCVHPDMLSDHLIQNYIQILDQLKNERTVAEDDHEHHNDNVAGQTNVRR